MDDYANGIMQATRSTYLDEVNTKIKALEAENSFLSKKIESKVINRRSGAVKTRTKYAEFVQLQSECIQKYWMRVPRSNSNSFVYHQVQNLASTNDDREPILLSRQLVRG